MNKILLAWFFFISFSARSQTFNGTGGAIPDFGAAATCYPINVTGVGIIDATFGLATVCIDITHTLDADLEIVLQTPGGANISLSMSNGSTGDNYTNTCFSMSATVNITGASPPFTGTYIPQGNLGFANNGLSGSGTWQLCIKDEFPGEVGVLNSWSLTFNNTPATPPPVIPNCGGNPPAGDACSDATPVCNFAGYCGNTSAAYNVDIWPELNTAFCGGIQNNSFITFVASATTANFNVFVYNSQDGLGIQMFFYDGGCGSGPVTEHGCYYQLSPDIGAIPVSATNLIPGNTYYLMFDGYLGDVCDYSIVPLNGVNILSIDATATSICVGQTVTLTASGGNGSYTWTGPNLSSTSGATVIASPAATSIYSVTSVDPTGNCPFTQNLTINITTSAPPPIVTSPVIHCQGSIATPLTATGFALLWYTTLTGGTGSATAPTPSTSTIGATTYYVTQTLACGTSVRTPVIVNIVAPAPLPVVTTPLSYCQNATAAALIATGSGLLWYTTPTGGPGSPVAPVPSTGITGSFTYYVSQTVSGCEGPRAAIVVTVVATPGVPSVTSPISYCQNNIATALTASGTNLLWYTVASGGVALPSAPIPSTLVTGTLTWYVSQAAGTCRGPRAPLVVNIILATPAPAITNLNYCQGQTATALTASGTSLLWYSAATGGTGSATAPIPSTAIPGITTYYVTQTLSCGESVRTPLTVTVAAVPAAPVVNSPVTYCLNGPASALTAAGSGLLWYTTATGGTGLATAPIPSTNTTGNTTYYVSQTINCEGPRAAITVTVYNPPAAPATALVTYCQNVTATALTATGSNLLWFTNATGGTGSATAPTPATTTPGAVTYYVSQTVNGCESPRAPITITTLPATPAPTVTTPVIYCQGSIATAITATGTGLLWYTAATGGTGSGIAPIPSTTATGSTIYYVTQTAAPCGESVRRAIVVSVAPTPAAPLVNTPVVYCQNETAASLTATGSSLLWYTASTGGTGSATAPVPATAAIGNVTYYVSQSTGVCEGPRAAISVSINAVPIAPSVTTSITYCQNIPAAALAAGGSNVLWFTTATGGSGSITAPTPSTATPGIVTYYVSQTANGCQGPRASIGVTTLPSTPAPSATTEIVYCQGTTASALTATGAGLLWYTAATGGTGSAIAPVPATATTGSTIYYVSQTVAPCGESLRTPIVVTVNETPPAPAVGGPVTLCQNVIAGPLEATGSNLLWYTTASGGIGNPNTPDQYSTIPGFTVYYVSQTLGVCEGPRAAISVTINDYPDFGADKRETICTGDSVDLTLKFNTNNYEATWTFNGQLIENPAAVTESGSYQLEAISTLGCADTVLVHVKIQPPVPAFAGNDTIAIRGVPHQLNASGGVAFEWSPAKDLNLSTIGNPLVILKNDQQFEVKIVDIAGCVGSDKVFVKVYDGPTYYVPNAFSPNGDGLNDIFLVVPVGISRTDWFRVFNRFGELVFESNQWLKGWNGSFQGKIQNAGTYIWMVKGVNRYGGVIEQKGTVTLVR